MYQRASALTFLLTSRVALLQPPAYQLDASKATLLFVGEAPDTFKAGLAAAEKAGIPRDRVVVIQSPTTVRAYSTGNYGNIQKRAEGVRTVSAGLNPDNVDLRRINWLMI